MRKNNRVLWLFAFLAIVAPLVGSAPQAGAQGEILVGRISQVDGQLLRFVPDEKDWVAVVKDAPFGMDDALYSSEGGRAEFVMPNNTWVRIGAVTQVQLIALKQDVTEVDVASGVARFYNRSGDAVIKASAPYGYVLAQPGSSFDLYVGDSSLEVIALSGQVDFFHSNGDARYQVNPGSSSVVADSNQVAAGEGNVDADWDDWNAGRDSLWAKRLSVKGETTKYLPPALADDAYALEENGRWERVQYNGEYRNMWRPTTVAAGWAPFTNGRWTEYYGDNTWVPAESFGYCTHHYGNWVMVGNAWFWAPPVVATGVVAPVPWYPGRVAWIGSGADVGWVPLAPSEPYYAHHAWGPAATIIGTAAVVGVTVATLAYVNHAVVVPQRAFYGVNNYTSVRVVNVNKTTIINNYRSAPVVNNTIVRGYDKNRNRYNFTDVNVARKPHQTAMVRIERNEQIAKQATTVNAKTLERNVANAKVGTPVKAAVVERPKVTSKIVPTSEVNKPAGQVKFQQQDMKTKVKPAEVRTVPGAVTSPAGPAGKMDVKPTMQPGQSGVGKELQPATPGKAGEGKGLQAPTRPGTVTPSVQPGQSGVGKELQPATPGKAGEGKGLQAPTRPGTVTPSVQPGQSGVGKELQPATPGKAGEGKGLQAPTRPGTVTPSVQPGTSTKPGKEVKPSEQPVQSPAGRNIAPAGKPTTPVSPAETQQPSRPGQQFQPSGSSLPARPADQGKGLKSPSESLRPSESVRQPGQVRTPVQETPKSQMQAPKSSVQTQPKSAAPELKPAVKESAKPQVQMPKAPAPAPAQSPGKPAQQGQQSQQGEKKKQQQQPAIQ